MSPTPMSAIEPVMTALVSTLRSSTGVTGLLASSVSVYNDVSQGSVYPYVVVEAPTEVRWDTWGCPGKTLTVQVKAVTNGDADRGDKKGAQILNACVAALHFARPTVTNHFLSGIAYDGGETYTELVNGVKIRHTIGLFRVHVTQST